MARSLVNIGPRPEGGWIAAHHKAAAVRDALAEFGFAMHMADAAELNDAGREKILATVSGLGRRSRARKDPHAPHA